MKADPVKVTRLLKTARGQLDGILKMVEEDQYCADISHQLLACGAILRKVNQEVLRGHMESCVKEAFTSGNLDDAKVKIDELMALMEKMAK